MNLRTFIKTYETIKSNSMHCTYDTLGIAPGANIVFLPQFLISCISKCKSQILISESGKTASGGYVDNITSIHLFRYLPGTLATMLKLENLDLITMYFKQF